jgi:hypothetical protein
VWDDTTRGWFTGDTFGLSYRELDTARGAWILPTTTPVQFEPAPMAASIRRLLAADPACVYLTHSGRVGDVPRLGAMLLDHLARIVALGAAVRAAAVARPARAARLQAGLQRLCLDSLRAHGSVLPEAEILDLLAIDLELNAQGMAIWLDREAASAASPAQPPQRSAVDHPLPENHR